MLIDVTGLPQDVAELRLNQVGIAYSFEITRPTRDFFKVDEETLYVVRQKLTEQKKLLLTLAAKQRKEVS